MRILVSNDDGINAEGLGVLEKVAAELSSDVWVVAPETDQSGVSHSLSCTIRCGCASLAAIASPSPARRQIASSWPSGICFRMNSRISCCQASTGAKT